MPLLAENGPESWIWWSWVGDHTDEIRTSLWEHLVLTALAVGIGVLIAAPLALFARRFRGTYPPILVTTGALYAVPSIALFGLLIPITGLSRTTALIPLVSYTLLILVRNFVAGLDGVPPDVLDAAQGMGYSRSRQLVRVELPLALPVIMAGIRLATVSTVALVTVTCVIGQDSLGQLILDGLSRDFHTPLVVGTVLTMALAIVADLSLLLVQWLVTPWTHGRDAP